MSIDEYIRKTQEIIDSDNADEAEKWYYNLVSIFCKLIPGFEDGTSVLTANENSIWNMNYDQPRFSTDKDFLKDLVLLIEKLKIYREMNNVLSGDSGANTTSITNSVDNSIHITDSTIKKSTIGYNKNSEKKANHCKEIIGWIIGILGILATVIMPLLAHYNII